MSVIDQEHAISLLGGHEVIYKKILQKFIDSVDAGSYSFTANDVNGDFDAVARIIHSVKGVSENVGAMKVKELAVVLDQQAKDHLTNDIISGIDGYNAAMAEACNEIRQILSL
ncbi:Hpt domain-containing protein [Umboniibacter marinipuniceus]|uniref:Hpt domain-containing protein n=1 Tax=Umboniibacter marinipuniceus TaxID=569599 RepID=A0A3M0A6R9_9GAMM|nr:Hpt domain-containing protein [Umboniibacter marinipuniceus]RMA80297.1 Hpt domain-containing protein [Umboniibacter marinipuniceus]